MLAGPALSLVPVYPGSLSGPISGCPFYVTAHPPHCLLQVAPTVSVFRAILFAYLEVNDPVGGIEEVLAFASLGKSTESTWMLYVLGTSCRALCMGGGGGGGFVVLLFVAVSVWWTWQQSVLLEVVFF